MLHNKFYRMVQKKDDYVLLNNLIKTFFMDPNDLSNFFTFFKKIPRSLKNVKVNSLGITLKPYYNTKLSCNLMDNIINFYVENNDKMNNKIYMNVL